MKPFTPAKIKADLLFVASLVAVFGFSIPDSISVAVVGSAGLIAAALNLGDSFLEKYAPSILPSAIGEIKTVESDLRKLLPEILPVIEALPGSIGAEVKKVLETVEKGPQAGEAVAGGNVKEATSTASKTK